MIMTSKGNEREARANGQTGIQDLYDNSGDNRSVVRNSSRLDTTRFSMVVGQIVLTPLLSDRYRR